VAADFLLFLWLPPPRQLGVVEELLARVGDCSWPALVIMRGLVPSLAKSQKVTLVDCSCH
jgi:hypothetical protein